MVFANLDELMVMGGHGPYVWAAYLVTVFALIALAVAPLLAQRRQLAEIARRERRDIALASQSAGKETSTEKPE